MKLLKSNLIGPHYDLCVKLNNEPIRAIIDTGSVCSVVTENFVKNSLKQCDIKPLSELSGDCKHNIEFVTASGDTLPYLGYISVQVNIPTIATVFETLFLVIPSTQDDHVLLGTNILALLKPFLTEKNNVVSQAVYTADKLLNNFHTVRSGKQKIKLENQSINFCTANLKVMPARFDRSVMLTPTDNTLDIPHVTLATVCITIPKHVKYVTVPFRAVNSCEHNRFLSPHFPLYNVASIQNIGDDVGSSNYDPVNESISDDDLIRLFNINEVNFTQNEYNRIRSLIIKHRAIFALNEFQLGCYTGEKYKIELTDDKPIRQRYREIPPGLYEQVQDQLKMMLKCNIISETTSPYSSPLTVCKKKDGSIRLAVDYRQINAKCKSDAKPIPRVTETLEKLGGNQYFSSVDCISAYWQFPITDDSKQYTAFTAGSGKLYEFNRVPYGHTGSGNYFQRAIETSLSELLETQCVAFLDDVLCWGRDFNEQYKHLDNVLTRLQSVGLKLKPKKCKLFETSICYLGHYVSKEGIRPDPSKLKIIEEWAEPKDTAQLRSWYGTIAYYRRFIKSFSKRASAITELFKGTLKQKGNRKKFQAVKFHWGNAQHEAFLDLKSAFLKDVCLHYPDFSQPFILETDASRGAFGAVLSQKVENKIRPIAFASRKTTASESLYPSHKLEFAALRWAICHKFKDYLYNQYCDVYCDNSPVTYILEKADIDCTAQRWCADLAKFDFKVHYRSGKLNKIADTLSRLTAPDKPDTNLVKQWCQDIVRQDTCTTDSKTELQCINQNEIKTIMTSASYQFPLYDQLAMSAIQNKENVPRDIDIDNTILEKCELRTADNSKINWKNVQNNDSDIRYAMDNIVNKSVKFSDLKNENAVRRLFFKKRATLVIEDGLLYKTSTNKHSTVQKQIVLNKSCLPVLMEHYHNKQAHLGEDRTVKILQDRFYWYDMINNIRDAIKNCTTCLARKTLPSQNRTEMHHRPEASHPFDIIAIDHLTVENRDGRNTKILTICCEYSKYLWILPVRDEKGKTTADAIIKNIFLKYGVPRVIHSDNASGYKGHILKELTKFCNIHHTNSVPYCSQSNPHAERNQRVILDLLGTLTSNEKLKWYKHCDYLAYSYNTTINCATGFSPYYLMFGRHPRLIGDAILGISLNQKSHLTVKSFTANLERAYKLCRERLREKRIKYKKYYDSKLSKNIVQLSVGDIVLVKNQKLANKIDNRWSHEPYRWSPTKNTYIQICNCSGNEKN